MTTGALQSRINPPVQQPGRELSVGDVKSESPALDNGGQDVKKSDFKSILLNSNDDVQKKREITKKGDLSTAKNDEELFKMLQEQSQPKRTPKNTLDKDDFLKLFVTQLQHQDPLNPQDSSQMAAQLANFNSLEQMMNMNKTLDKMATGQNENRSLNMVGYIGKEVTINNGSLLIKGGQQSDASFSIEKPIANAKLEIRDSAGIVVATKELGNLSEGEHKLDWDGKSEKGVKISDGMYRFSIAATDEEANQVPVKTTSKVIITGVDLQDKTGGTVYTSVGRVNLADISAVGNPGFMNAAKPDAKVDAKGEPKAPGNPVEKLKQSANPKNMMTDPNKPGEPGDVSGDRQDAAGRPEEKAAAAALGQPPPAVTTANAEQAADQAASRTQMTPNQTLAQIQVEQQGPVQPVLQQGAESANDAAPKGAPANPKAAADPAASQSVTQPAKASKPTEQATPYAQQAQKSSVAPRSRGV